MGDESDANHVLDPALPQERHRESPEVGSVVRKESRVQQEPRETPRRLAQIRP